MKFVIEFFKNLLRILKKYLEFSYFKAKWKVNNEENFTIPGNLFPMNKVEVGKRTYGTLNVYSYKTENEFLKIGKFCSIANDVNFLLGGEHIYSNLMTFPFKTKLIANKEYEAYSKGPIIVDDDVWIGFGSIILSGVHIGKGAIIGAGSVVTKDIPPYAIYAGNRIVKYRFSENVIKKLVEFDFNEIDENKLESKLDLLYTNCTDENIDELIRKVKE